MLVHAWFDPPKVVKETTTTVAAPTVKKDLPSSSIEDTEEEYFVLENEFQQLVFSTRGGALVEINLPFYSEQKPKSFVKKVDLDRQLLEQAPRNALFPLRAASVANETGQRSSYESKQGGYYPLLRRPTLNRDGTTHTSLKSQFYALNLVSDEENLSNLSYKVTQFENDKISFEATNNGRRITKTYTVPKNGKGPYCFELSVNIEGDAKGLWLTSGVPEVELISGSFIPVLRYQIAKGKSFEVEDIDLSDKKPSLQSTSFSPDWVSNSNGFLGLILDPIDDSSHGFRAEKIPAVSLPTRLTLLDPFVSDKYPGYSTALSLKSGKQLFRVFAGPYDDRLLKELNLANQDETAPNYENAKSITGWFSFISEPFSQFLSFLLNIFYTLTHSWGFSIILLTIALRIMMYPLNSWSIRSTLRMQQTAPKVKAIRDRYKKDPKKGQLEVMNFYRSQGINPLSGCLPMLLQMPFLIGMFYLLKSSFQLRGASFIPGWIDNLAAPDVLFSWSSHIILIGTQFHLLPILLGAITYLQQKLNTKATEGAELSDMQQQQKMMSAILPIFLTVMFYSFPSGLNIYFISSTLLGILQQWMVAKKLQAKKA